MSDKKKHEQEEVKDSQETQPEVVETVEVIDSAMEMETLQKQLAEYKDSWMRAQAEFQNYKRRVERDNELTYASMKGDIIKKVLPVLDDLERALQNRVEGDAWAGGIELIARKLQNTLEAEGVKRIEAKGKVFDPNFHEAISHEPSNEVESEHVIDVVQNGYMLGERVIRPAMVRVAQ